MLPEAILQSSVLDILFENRNKTYGAYTLRKQYNARLAKAIICVAVFTLVLALLLRCNKQGSGKKVPEAQVFETVNLLSLPQVKEQPAKKMPLKLQQPAKPATQVKLTDNIEIVKTAATDTIPTVKALDVSAVGDKNVAGNAALASTGQFGSNNAGAGLQEAEKEEINESAPVETADVMPQYPGGNGAFQKFMQRNLRQPGDLEAGEKIVVLVRFVVEKDGSVAGAEIVGSGRKDLGENVLDALAKMPRWVPGLSHGRKVAVYFKLPVTFVAEEQ